MAKVPTQETMESAQGQGTMAEHSLSEGSTKGLGRAVDKGSYVEEHKLQHANYSELTGENV